MAGRKEAHDQSTVIAMTGDELEVKRALRALHGEGLKSESPLALRRKLEKSALNPNDGRRKRATGRTVQLNTTIRPETKTALVEASRHYNKTIVELIERGIALAIAELEKKHA
jgi:hypothetical protein